VRKVRVGAKVDNYGDAVVANGLAHPARRAEEAGFDSVWLSDHVIMVDEHNSPYPFSRDGSLNWDTSAPWYDAIVSLATVAAVTSRVEVGMKVLIPVLRHPVVLAKQLASIDALSGGRVVLGVGAGWYREEFEALGVPWADRGTRLDETIEVLRRCWTGRPDAFEGKHLSLPEGVVCFPSPAHEIPIIVGGMSDAALQRAQEQGQGWFPRPMDDEDPAAVIARGRDALADRAGGTYEGRIIASAGTPESVRPYMDALVSAGTTDLIVDVDFSDPDGPEKALAALRSD
jgi:probable F420-dependent oxidoreductase